MSMTVRAGLDASPLKSLRLLLPLPPVPCIQMRMLLIESMNVEDELVIALELERVIDGAGQMVALGAMADQALATLQGGTGSEISGLPMVIWRSVGNASLVETIRGSSM